MLDLWRGRISPRRVALLVYALPPDSAFRQAQNGRKPLWTTTDYILADVYDAIQGVQWTHVALNAKRKPDAPTPYPRPGEERPKYEVTSAALLDHAARTRKS